MARKEIKSQGKDVATAIIKGLNELGRRRDQVEVTVIQEEKQGFLGIGGRPAIVQIIEKKWDSEHSTPMKPRAPKSDRPAKKSFKDRKKKDFKRGSSKHRVEKFVTPKTPKENEPQKLPSAEIQNAVIPQNMQEPMKEAKETLAQILQYMGVKTENLNVWWDGVQERVLLTFDCDHPAVVIGKEGKTLESIQYIITLVISRHFDKPVSVIADTQNYWRKLEDKIDSEIDRAVSMVKRTKKDYRFRPMSAQIRRYVHRYVVNNDAVTTISEGEGKWRKVVLKYNGKSEEPEAVVSLADQELTDEAKAALENNTPHIAPEQAACEAQPAIADTESAQPASEPSPVVNAPDASEMTVEESKVDAQPMDNLIAANQAAALDGIGDTPAAQATPAAEPVAAEEAAPLAQNAPDAPVEPQAPCINEEKGEGCCCQNNTESGCDCKNNAEGGCDCQNNPESGCDCADRPIETHCGCNTPAAGREGEGK